MEQITIGLLRKHLDTELNTYLDAVQHTVMQDVLSLNLIGRYKNQLMVHAALLDITVELPTTIVFVLIALTSEQLSKVSLSLFCCFQPDFVPG